MTPQASLGRSAPWVHRPQGLRGSWSVQRALAETTCPLEAGHRQWSASPAQSSLHLPSRGSLSKRLGPSLEVSPHHGP